MHVGWEGSSGVILNVFKVSGLFSVVSRGLERVFRKVFGGDLLVTKPLFIKFAVFPPKPGDLLGGIL